MVKMAPRVYRVPTVKTELRVPMVKTVLRVFQAPTVKTVPPAPTVKTALRARRVYKVLRDPRARRELTEPTVLTARRSSTAPSLPPPESARTATSTSTRLKASYTAPRPLERGPLA